MARNVPEFESVAFGAAMLVAALLVAAGHAAACPDGQRLAGFHSSAPDAAGQVQKIPVCVPDGAQAPGAGEASPPLPAIPLNMAIVWWNDAGGRPEYSYAYHRLHDATADAMAHCRLRGGLNCRLGFTAGGGWVAMVRAGDDSLFADWSKKKKDAQKKALRRCEAAGADACRLVDTIRNVS